MSELEEIMSVGERLGFKGKDLQDFLRDKRVTRKEEAKLAADREAAKLEADREDAKLKADREAAKL